MSDKTSDKTSDKRLLSCPFCSGDNIISTYNNFVPALLCGGCGAMMTIPWDLNKDTETELRNKWNTRKPMQNIVERIEAECKEITKWDSDKHYIYKEGADWMGNKAIEIVKEEGGV